MSSTTPSDPSPTVDRATDGSRLHVELAGPYDAANVVSAMARVRHAAERFEPDFAVLLDVGECSVESGALAALGEWETLLRAAGAAAVVRVGEGRVLGGADHTAPSPEAALEALGSER